MVAFPRLIQARAAVKKAHLLRSKLGIATNVPINPFRVAELLNAEVRFIDIPSMEGMYIANPEPLFVLSSLRPLQRQLFTCAHEIGHAQLEHGDTIDALVEQRESAPEGGDKEFQADAFAANLLMPSTAISAAISARGLNVETADARQFYALASYFGVGYSTLVRHLQFGVRTLGWLRATEILRKTPRQIRAEILEGRESGNLIVIDRFWLNGSLAEAEVGDFIIAPLGAAATSNTIRLVEPLSLSLLFEVVRPGICEVQVNGVSISIRAARKNYMGRLENRYAEEIESE